MAQRTGRNGTPLHSAIAAGKVEIVRFLLEQGVDPQVKNEEGYTAGEWAEKFGKGDVSDVLKGAWDR